MENNRAETKAQIAKYEAQIKRIKNIIPLITMYVVAHIFFMKYINSLLLALVLVAAIGMYAGSFILAYYQCISKIKKLNQELNNHK